MSYYQERACRACGSLMCSRDEDCPTCDRCGKRGHSTCTAGAREQPPPTPSTGPSVWALVLEDMRARDAAGAAKYGTRLQTGNGRDFLLDAYQEALDLAVYLRGAIYERDGR